MPYAAQGGSDDGAVRIGIADDHELSRAGLRAMLSGEPGLALVGEAANGGDALQLCRNLRPDLMLMDMRMPVMDGLTATRAIKAELPETRVVIVTMHEDPDYLVEALRAGAAGYILKDASRRELLQAVRQVMRGESFLNSQLTTQVLTRLAAEPGSAPGPHHEQLTRRELEVLELLAQGLTNREIANILVISPGTAKVHVERILSKLEVADRTQAAVRAVETGLVKRLHARR
jgi:DNA-binding NarL/FixJ family response regulator